MGDLLILQTTIFVLIATGFFVKRLGLVSKEGQKNITDLVINVVLPCNIITSFTIEAGPETFWDCASIFAVSVGIQIFCVVYGKILYRRQDENRRKCLRYGTICSNAGFLGSPIAEGVFGEIGLMYSSVYLIPVRVMMWSEGIAIFSGEKNFRSMAKKVATHPCVVACIAGILLMAGKITLPAFILTPLSTLGQCNTALSMLVIGMILAEIDLKTIFDKTVLWYSLNRLVVIPLVIYLVCLLLPVSATIRGISVLLAAMPAGATTSMLAAKYDRDPGFATKLVVFSTLCSIPAIMIWSAVVTL